MVYDQNLLEIQSDDLIGIPELLVVRSGAAAGGTEWTEGQVVPVRGRFLHYNPSRIIDTLGGIVDEAALTGFAGEYMLFVGR